MSHKYIIPMIINEITNRSSYDRLIGRLDAAACKYQGKVGLKHLLPLPTKQKSIHLRINIEVAFCSHHDLAAFLNSDVLGNIKKCTPESILRRAFVVNEDRFNCPQLIMCDVG